MTQEYRRGLTHGAVLMLVIAVVGWQYQGRVANAAIAKADSAAARSLAGLLAQKAVNLQLEKAQAATNRYADSVSAIAEALIKNAKPVGFTVIRPVQSVGLLGGDTTEYIQVQRPVDVRPHPTPKFLVDELRAQELQKAVYFTAWVGEQRARLQADSVTIPGLRQELRLAGKHIEDKEDQIRTRDRARKPWCQMKCGIAIGVGGTVAAAYGLTQIAELRRDGRD